MELSGYPPPYVCIVARSRGGGLMSVHQACECVAARPGGGPPACVLEAVLDLVQIDVHVGGCYENTL